LEDIVGGGDGGPMEKFHMFGFIPFFEEVFDGIIDDEFFTHQLYC